MRIAIDAMGGDHAPVETVRGAIASLKEMDASLLLIGDQEAIESELKKYDYDTSRVEVLHTTEVITGEDKPVKAIKRKKDSSMVVGLSLLRKKEIDGFLSAGNTGALLAGGLLKVGRIPGVDRPALASVYPTEKKISLLVDAGANAECKPRNLKEFGIMGSIYATFAFDVPEPKVGLVNIGHEEGKGNSLVIDAYDLLKESDLNFIGNLEAREIPYGSADVIVCDGFTGNVILKLSEGLAKSFGSRIKNILTANPIRLIAGAIVKKGMDDFKKSMDYREYGGAPLLGVRGLVVKAHGSSDAKAISSAIRYAHICATSNVVDRIAEAIQEE